MPLEAFESRRSPTYIAEHDEHEKEVSNVQVLLEERRLLQRAVLESDVFAVDHVGDRAGDR